MTLAILLFAVGVLLVILELFIPTFGVLPLCAVGSFAVSVWQAYQSSGPGAAWAMAIIAPVVSIVIVYFGLKAAGRKLVIRRPADEGTPEKPTVSETAYLPPEGGTDEAVLADLVGKDGVTQSQLRPVGVALIDGRRVDVVTEGGVVDPGARIRVVAVEGNRVVVRRVKV